MYDNQILQISVPANRNLDYAIQNEIKNEQPPRNELTIPDIAISLSPLGFIIGWVVFLLILQKIRSFLDYKMVFPTNSSHKVPCKSCRFYSNNNYLKCAVKPSIVLTEEARNCSEYSANKKRFY
ncbi:hypothetical protein IQ276_035025 [Desmonostoc muscorum LEGE 12446]|uniref:hypothetical protein n=1 Tax=Desmonostoc muscorum TaxID=1179 RepID=UPI0018813E0C|nr:hypothetical protein [Desmonostoc muscorum]MCF2151531.1 hypothetical protein [Desmonostoc muscorum LEGE 12446]